MDINFHEYVIIRIASEKNIQEVRRFIHPYDPAYHMLFFSQDHDLMLEVMENDRIFLYEWDAGHNSWKLIRRMVDYPSYIEKDSINQKLMTPDFSKYLNFNNDTQQFEIIESKTQALLFTVPYEFMKINDKKELLTVLNRFAWVDNHTYKFVTRSGIQRLIEFSPNGVFREKNFSFVPEFDIKETEEEDYYTGLNHCYKADEIEERLFRKYRIYKSNYFMHGFRKSHEMYPKLFHADYYSENCLGRIMMDMSFTFLNWKIIEQLRDGEI